MDDVRGQGPHQIAGAIRAAYDVVTGTANARDVVVQYRKDAHRVLRRRVRMQCGSQATALIMGQPYVTMTYTIARQIRA